MANLPLVEIRRAFREHIDVYPPVPSLSQAAKLSQLAPADVRKGSIPWMTFTQLSRE